MLPVMIDLMLKPITEPEYQIMRTTITIDDDLVEELQKFTGAGSRSAAISQAVEEFVRREKVEKFLREWVPVEIEDTSRETLEADLRRERFLDSLRD